MIVVDRDADLAWLHAEVQRVLGLPAGGPGVPGFLGLVATDVGVGFQIEPVFVDGRLAERQKWALDQEQLLDERLGRNGVRKVDAGFDPNPDPQRAVPVDGGGAAAPGQDQGAGGAA